MAKLRQVDPSDYIEPGTSFKVILGYVVFGFGLFALTLSTFGIALLAGLIGLIVHYFRIKIAHAAIHGSALKVGPKQFPEIYAMTAEVADAMDMDPPDVYIFESNQQNAFAVKAGSKKFVMLVDDVVYGIDMIQKPDAMRWLIAHELAHHALGHTGLIRSSIVSVFPPLSRLDELSCDAVAAAVVGQQAGYDALKLLTVGPQLFAKVNDNAFGRQAIEVEEEKRTIKAERPMTHPLILRRLARMIPDTPTEKTTAKRSEIDD